jgi:fibro-slime domain-containing protein
MNSFQTLSVVLVMFSWSCGTTKFTGSVTTSPAGEAKEQNPSTDLEASGIENPVDTTETGSKGGGEGGEKKPLSSNKPPQFISVPETMHKYFLNNPNQLSLSGVVRDLKAEHSDFETAQALGETGHKMGLVMPALDGDGKPVFAGPDGRAAIASQESFRQWYRDVAGINQSFTHQIDLMKDPSSGVFSYASNEFFPADGKGFGNEGRLHNFHFTYEIESRFTYKGGERFTFIGDDDVWVFINNRLVVDLGGVHGSITGSIDLDTLGLVMGQSYALKLFFAERHTFASNFRIDTTIELKANTAYRYQAEAKDPDGDALLYSLSKAPEGMIIDSQKGTISWDIAEKDIGSHDIVVAVTDGQHAPVTQSFTLLVTSD